MATNVINGTAGNDLIVAHDAASYQKGELVVVMAATSAQGGWPHPNIIVNGQVLARDVPITAYLLAGNMQVVTVALPTDTPVNSVAIQYWDDLVTSQEDRNIYVSSVTLNGTTLPLEQAVYTRYDYPTIPGQHDMDWNGFMTWSGPVVTNAMAGGTTANNDAIDGGAGTDTVTYQGRATGYSIAYNSDGTFAGVTPKSGSFATDTFHNVENILFDDNNAYGGGFDTAIDVNAGTIDGGRGLDTLALQGNHTQYIIQHTTTGFSITGNGVNEWVTNVERLQFSDGVVALDITGDAGQAYRLYQAAFNRVPDLPGLGYQTNAIDTGLTLVQVAANFIASPEFQSRYGNVDNTRFVTLLYENVLHREPEQDGLNFHLNELASGQSRAEVLTHFSESPENQANVIGQIQDGMFFYPVAS